MLGYTRNYGNWAIDMMIKIDNEPNPRVWGMLSISKKAGKLVSGEGRVQDAVRGDSAYAIIVSADASQNTQKKFLNMGNFRDLPVILMSDRYSLGKAIGSKIAVVLAVCDKGLADNIIKILTDSN